MHTAVMYKEANQVNFSIILTEVVGKVHAHSP